MNNARASINQLQLDAWLGDERTLRVLGTPGDSSRVESMQIEDVVLARDSWSSGPDGDDNLDLGECETRATGFKPSYLLSFWIVAATLIWVH